jgi:hypothetical protein
MKKLILLIPLIISLIGCSSFNKKDTNATTCKPVIIVKECKPCTISKVANPKQEDYKDYIIYYLANY